MIERASRQRTGFMILGDLVGDHAPILRARARGTLSDAASPLAEGTDVGVPRDGQPAARRVDASRELRVRLVLLIASERDHEGRAALMRQIVHLGRPLPAGVLRALASLAQDREPRVRWAACATLVHLIEVLTPIERSELIGRLATSSRFELRLLLAQALRHGALAVGTVSALELLVDDVEPEVRRAALVSARLRLAQAPHRMGTIMRRKLTTP